MIEVNNWPIKIRETSWANAEHHDFEFHALDGRGIVGVAEAKCRSGKYTEAYFEKEGLLVERERYEGLMSAWGDLGALVILVLLTADEKVYMISFNKLTPLIPDLEVAGSYMLKDDHGKRPTNKGGWILPLEYMTYVGENNE